uniref:Lon protease homolog n=1 Tax=Blastobotrys adeninivorans TaxID=409370 RepID=A0A060T362_BLAAD
MIRNSRQFLRTGARSAAIYRQYINSIALSERRVVPAYRSWRQYSTDDSSKKDDDNSIDGQTRHPNAKDRDGRAEETSEIDQKQKSNRRKPKRADEEAKAKEKDTKESKESKEPKSARQQPPGEGGANPSSSQPNKPSNFGFRPASPNNKKQVLTLLLQDRPAIPGYHRACRVTDPELVYALRRIFYENLEDQCIAVFLRRPGMTEKGTEVMRNVDDAYPIGAYCRIGGIFTRYEDNQGGCTITLLPLSRVRIGDLVDPTTPGKEGAVSESLDVTSFDTAAENDIFSLNVPWMQGLRVVDHEPYDVQNQEVQALCAEIIEVMRQLSSMSSTFREQIASFAMISLKPNNESSSDPAALADFAAAMCEGTVEIQDILETLNIKERLEKSLVLLRKELMQVSLQDKFKKNVEVKLQNRYKKVYLEEKMNEIKKELGTDTKEKSTNVFRERMSKLTVPEHVQKAFEEEMTRLESTDPSSIEHSMTRNYVDWLTQMPWGKFSDDKYDILEARRILDRDHYGLKDVKDRILEFIATARLSGTVAGKIICFVGPPGVGKTSIGKSIAESLGKKFARISVGGANDVSEIKGHRRTYVGAIPGRVIQALKQCQTQNPLILIDEVDKIGRMSAHGDPSAALLELLDPEQNSSFVDTFLDLPIDVSKVFFVCTANYGENIPAPLKDRMEMIDVSGYVASERIAIAEQYLVPASKKQAGLDDISVNFSREAVEALVNKYSRENGVRGLKKLIEKVHRKVALQIVQKYDKGFEVDTSNDKEAEQTVIDATPSGTTTEAPESATQANAASADSSEAKGAMAKRMSKVMNEVQSEEATSTTSESSESAEGAEAESAKVEPKRVWKKVEVPEDVSISIDGSNLKDFVGPPVHLEDRMYEDTPAGVVMGLAFTEMGGSPLYVESVLQQPLRPDGKPEFHRTGQLGEVMNESSAIAYSFCRMFMSKHFPRNRFFEKAMIHMHCPEGAIKKDGPSAGVTMTTSLLSLALDFPVDSRACMTGELTLTGKVIRIGGLKEKAMAAKMAGAKTIFFPHDNLADWENLPDFIREGLEPVPVKWYRDIFDRLFAGLDREAAKTLWESQLLEDSDNSHQKTIAAFETGTSPTSSSALR